MNVEFTAQFIDSCGQAKNRISALLEIVSSQTTAWPEIAVWQQLLPPWFVDSCGPILTLEEMTARINARRAMPAAKQQEAAANQQFSIAGWLYWLEPENRTWTVEAIDCIGEHELRITISIDGLPTALEAFYWMIKAAGGNFERL